MCGPAGEAPSVSYHCSHCDSRSSTSSRSSAKMPESLAETPTLPSPSLTIDGLDNNDEIEIVAPPCPSVHSRKRRLSDGDSHGVAKRPRGVFSGPYVHVSDPLPRPSVSSESGIDDWFQTNFFEIPPPVENVGFDQSTPLDIEVFSGYTLSDTQENSLPTLADSAWFVTCSEVALAHCAQQFLCLSSKWLIWEFLPTIPFLRHFPSITLTISLTHYLP
jgi:hypothetical protein